MEELKKLRAARGYVKGSMTRIFRFLENPVELEITSIAILRAKQKRLEQLFTEFETYNKDILAFDEGDNENNEEIEETYFNALAIFNERININFETATGNCPTFKAKLPTIQIPVFRGKYSDYTPFINLFRAMVHNDKSLEKVQKLYYLRSFLEREPLDLIKNLPLASNSYDEALQLLNDRYNQTFKIVNEHINSLLDMPSLYKSTPNNIREYVSHIKQCLSSLKNLDVRTENWDPIILAILYRKLDAYTLRAYHLDRNEGIEPTIVEFLSYLDRRALALENSESPSFSGKNHNHKAAVNIATTSESRSCLYCKSSEHKLYTCAIFKSLVVLDRLSFAKENKLCQVCLNAHQGRCKYHFRCNICRQAHNTLLHKEVLPSQPTVTLISNIHSNKVLLPTVRVRLYSKSGQEVRIKAILDSASQISIATSRLINVLGITPAKINTQVLGVSNTNNAVHYSVPLEVFSLCSPYKVTINCHVLDKITCKIPQFKVDASSLQIPPGIHMADDNFGTPSDIDMLMGADIFFQVLIFEQQNLIHQSASQYEYSTQQQHLQPRFINTKFGYVIAGALPQQSLPKSSKVSLLCLDCESNINEKLNFFWKTEDIPETCNENFSEQELCENIYKDTTLHRDNKFQVDLPLKVPLHEINNIIGNSFDSAYYRFLNLERKLYKNAKLLNDYRDFINEYVELGHAHYVDLKTLDFHNDPLYFLPHHAVLNENSKTTKTRVVFDASMQTDKKVSLNDLLLSGPSVQNELFDIMILFRLGTYTFSTDIRRMFRCVSVNLKHATLQNILWRNNVDEPIKCIQLDTVTYGQKSSSYLATRCLLELANKYEEEFPLASYILKNCTYVDDTCFSHSDLEVIIEAKRQLCELLKKGSFYTHKWASNSPQLLQDVPLEKQHFDELDIQRHNVYMKTLGLTLNVREDCFVISCPEKFDIELPTKRQILSYISKFYDPLGFISPVIVKAKVFMQRLWDDKIGWNEVPSEILRLEWFSFAKKLSEMKPLQVSRNISSPKNAIANQIIGFADASSSIGYGCSVYLRVVDSTGKASLSLLCSKSRINPRNKDTLTVPRLELNAMLLLGKLVNRVYSTLGLKIGINNVYLFSDSQISLAWIATEPLKLQAYVANRVKLIQELTSRWHWLYIPSSENPADLVSRGTNPDELLNCKLWWQGPEFLQDGNYDFCCNTNLAFKNDLPEMKKEFKEVSLITQINKGFYSFLDNYSDINKMARVMAFILRFCNNLRHKTSRQIGYLSSLEVSYALNKIIQSEQNIYFKQEITSLLSGDYNVKGQLKSLHPYLDSDNFLRVGGRINNSNVPFSQRHPIILPKLSRITELIIYSEHVRLLHAGPKLLLSSLNQRYWLIDGYRQVKKFIYKCLLCFKMKAQSAKQLMGSLPAERVIACRPFQKIGIDYAGPLVVRNSRVRRAIQTKGYICIFVCFVSKAVHLELSSDLSTDSFLACFKRFVARRGLPSDVFSDNGSNFRGARNELDRLYKLQKSKEHQSAVQTYANQHSIAFHFIPSYSPIFAGLAEAAVKSMKFHLKRILQNYILTYEQLHTILCQIEGVLNSRPLLPVTAEDINDFSYITPGHFLIGCPLTSFPERCTYEVPSNRLKFWELCNKVKSQFWKIWHKYYLNILQSRPKWRESLPNVKVGSLVILREPNTPPLSWPMARIIKVYSGGDDKVRVVDVVTSNKKVYKRSLSGICVLPLE